jgi:uncharacterized membrane-anchored protein YhcB (DUF1043 family)
MKLRISINILPVFIFIIGIFCGFFIDRLIYYKMPPKFSYQENRIKEKLYKELNLTEEQKEKLTQILNKHKQLMEKLKEEIKPKFEELKQSLRKEIRLILNDEQKKKE